VAGPKNKPNRRKQTGAKPWIAVFIVVVLLGVALAGLEYIKGRGVPKGQAPAPSPGVPEVVKPAQTQVSTAVQSVQKRISTAGLRLAMPSPLPQRSRPGKIAIIIDDMGSSVQEVTTLMAIGVPLSFSVIPGLPKAAAVAQKARQQGYQVMLHLPMEPEGYPQRRLENNGLLVAHSPDELRQRVTAYLKAVPEAQGANNHMGSRFTANREKMRSVLGVLQENGLFYIDSVTTPRSVGMQEARQLGMKTAARHVFLDNVQDVAAIRKQLQQLAAVARKRGGAIGICHPHPATIRALQQILPELAKGGITFVSAGDLVS
jgi:polysaccharide deacetylase 2 family uncharacterized protein YibQ